MGCMCMQAYVTRYLHFQCPMISATICLPNSRGPIQMQLGFSSTYSMDVTYAIHGTYSIGYVVREEAPRE
jgi:hypothetical protein